MTAALLLSLIIFAPPSDLLTVAESSDFTLTSRHAQVMDLLDRIEARSSIMRRGELGTTVEGKSIPLVILSDPPVENAAQARASGKPIFFAFGNIHAGEVCGKEALLMLARELPPPRTIPCLKNSSSSSPRSITPMAMTSYASMKSTVADNAARWKWVCVRMP